MDLTPQFIIAIVVIIGLFGFLGVAVWRLSVLASNDENARGAFLNFMNPASIVSILILLGVLFLIGMAILDLDKGRVLLGMGRTSFARGLITYLFAIVTIGTAVVLVLEALIGTNPDRFNQGKEVLGLLLGVFGTIVGFYFAAELAKGEDNRALTVSSILLNSQEAAPSGSVTVTLMVLGGTPPYRFGVAISKDQPGDLPELVRPDGWIVKPVDVPANTPPGVLPIRVAIQDADGQRASAQSFIKVTGPPSR